jgi:hypothetical protein
MLYFVIFLLELSLLFFLSRFFNRSLLKLLYGISKDRSIAINLLTILLLPGTMIHEVAHALVAGLLLVPVGEIEIFPKVEEDKILLGSVQVGTTDPLRRLIIGGAPLLLGTGIIISILYWALNTLNSATPWWVVAAVVVLIFQISNTMFSSDKDMEGALAFIGAILTFVFIVFLAAYFTGFLSYLSFLQSINFPDLTQFFKKVDLILVIPLLLDLFFWLSAKILGHRY